jgi:ABC-type transport system involved in multi-copper enzyme maturation permease subunit
MAVVGHRPEGVLAFLLKIPVLLATAIHLAPALAEELEHKTHTYLWSRPVPRFAVLTGKLLAHAPLLIAGFCASAALAYVIVTNRAGGGDPTLLLRTFAAVVASVLAGGALAVGAGTLFTKRPLAFVLGYMLVGEQVLQFVPLLQKLSIAYYTWAIAGVTPPGRTVFEPITELEAVIGLTVLGGAWLAVGAWRITRAEYATSDQ